MVLDDDLAYEILAVVEEIPEGNVATYGQIARLIGREKNALEAEPLRDGRALRRIEAEMRVGKKRHLRQKRAENAEKAEIADDDRVHAGGDEALHLIGLASGVAAGVFELHIDVTGLSFFLNGLTDNGEKVLIEVGH